MRGTIDDRFGDDARREIRGLVRLGFAGEMDGPDVEVHVRGLSPRCLWVLPCDDPRCDPDVDVARGRPFPTALGETQPARRAHVGPTRRRLRCRSRDAGEAVRFADDRGTSFSGWAYDGVPAAARVAPSTRYLVTLRVPLAPRASVYPMGRTYHRARTAGAVRKCWQEHLLHLAAPECRHLQQYARDLHRSEVDAEEYAHSVLRRSSPVLEVLP